MIFKKIVTFGALFWKALGDGKPLWDSSGNRSLFGEEKLVVPALLDEVRSLDGPNAESGIGAGLSCWIRLEAVEKDEEIEDEPAFNGGR